MTVTIYHNPACGTSRNTLAMIRQSGEEPTIIDYLTTPPSRDRLVSLIQSMNIPVRALLREKEAIFSSLGLGSSALSDDQLIDAMISHPFS
jgi:arsenate reductase